jgi:hypothetical protein
MQFLRYVRASSVMTFHTNFPKISIMPTSMIRIASAGANFSLYVSCIQYLSGGIKELMWHIFLLYITFSQDLNISVQYKQLSTCCLFMLHVQPRSCYYQLRNITSAYVKVH